MENNLKSSVYVFKCLEHKGYGVRLYKEENGERYVSNFSNVEWIKINEGMLFPYTSTFIVDEFEQYNSIHTESSLHGENKALKDEIKFLRNQIEMLLGRK